MRKTNETPITITPLGGLGEIGKNMTVIEWDGNAIIIDAGFKFPDSDLPGIDKVIPDMTYITQIAPKVKAIMLTHGHADHIGGLRYVLERVKAPVYGSELTIGIADEFIPGSVRPVDYRKIEFGKSFHIAGVKFEYIRVNHSIPEGGAIAMHFPQGVVIHSGDFKIDFNPIDGFPIDLQRFGDLGLKGVLCLLSDSTNADEEGYTGSESSVGKTFEKLFQTAPGRVIIATFATNLHRLQQIADVAEKYDRKLLIDGKSIIETIRVARRLGYFKINDALMVTPEQADKLPPNKVVIVTTGSQGEPMSGMSKIASATHPKIRILKTDTVCLSADPIPGNETLVSKIVSSLLKLGANVLYRSVDKVHVSGHGSQEEMKILLALTKPKYFIPVHGEYKHLWFHSQIAHELGVAKENIFLCENGDQIQLTSSKGRIAKKIPASSVYIDGASVGDIGTAVLKERTKLSKDGFMSISLGVSMLSREVIAGPEIFSQGFIYLRDSSDIVDELKQVIANSAKNWKGNKGTPDQLKKMVRDKVSDYLFDNKHSNPIITVSVLSL